MTAYPDLRTYRAVAAGHGVVPVTRRLLADEETPVGVYRKLAGDRPGTFLLESAEHGRSWSRYSFVGVRCAATLTVDGDRAVWRGAVPPGVPDGGADVLDALRRVSQALRSPDLPGLPPLTGGLVGYLAYDLVRRIERLPDLATDDLGLPDLALLLVTDLAVVDHHEGTVTLVANAFPGDDPDRAYADALARLDAMVRDLATPVTAHVGPVPAGRAPDLVTLSAPAGGYPAAVRRCQEEIRAGEVFQVVPSQRFEVATGADPLDVYRVLRTTNPSPYMYLLRFDDGVAVVGSSPEALVTLAGRRAVLHPIAGTHPRGATEAQDNALAAAMLADPKERAEHLMLVDLGRNDLGRVCAPGTVEVVDFMTVERYSHVMHLVSTLVGEVADGCGPVDVIAACFPAGTLSGAPKVRAMEIIEANEPTRRGLYGGAVGYLSATGDLDLAIAIRTALIRDGRAYVQAGGGIVADSQPEVEDAETRHKAAAVLRAIGAAEQLAGSCDADGDRFAAPDPAPALPPDPSG